jgi:predicted membrane chloride channel (bestrophin family)
MMSSNKSNLSAILSVFNTRLFIILLETIAIFFVYDYYTINIKVDYTIMSIAIIFPLVFSITSAYQRRQDAISLYLEFRNKIIDLTNIFYAVESVKDKNYNELFDSLQEVQKLLIHYLTQENSEKTFDSIREKRKDVLLIIDSHKKLFNEREKDSLIRVKNELFLSAEKIRGIKIHGTPISLKKYCLVFIYFSPLLYASQSVFNLQGDLVTKLISLSFSLVVSFVLMALYNVQDYIENPFDQKGLDDLKIDLLKVNQYESLHSK